MPSAEPPAATANARPSISALIARGLRRVCPTCGESPIFRGLMRMHKKCAHCGRSYDRGPGYLLGSIYFNYGVTALIVVIGYFGLYFGTELTGNQLLWGLTAFSLLFPLWFFRYARSLWIAFDELWDPWQQVDDQTPSENANASTGLEARESEVGES